MSSSHVYFVDNSVQKRLIPSQEVFHFYFGENWGIVKTYPMSLLSDIPEGLPLAINESFVISKN